MTLSKKLLSLFLAVLCLGLAACSDSSSDEPTPEKPYELDQYRTYALQRVWKITEYEPYNFSYYRTDTETSWLINQPVYTGSATINSFSYKLSTQSAVYSVDKVEVGTLHGESCIFNAETGDLLFAIEEMYDGGNRWIMVVQDREGNRYRCESVSAPSVYYLCNTTNYESLAVKYISAKNASGKIKRIDYTVASLPKAVEGAYAILLEDGITEVQMSITAPDGKQVLLTSSELTEGWNRGLITQTDFDNAPPSQVGFDTAAEEYLKGVFMDYDKYFFCNLEANGQSMFSTCVDGVNVYSCPGIRVKIDENGDRWIVPAANPNVKLYKLIEYGVYGPDLRIAPADKPSSEIWMISAPEAEVFFIVNNSQTYNTFDIQYTSYVEGSATKDMRWKVTGLKRDSGTFDYAVPVPWRDPQSDLTINATITARNDYGDTQPFTFNYSGTIPVGSTRIMRATITDADMTSCPTKEDAKRLEKFLWAKNQARAWRAVSYCSLTSSKEHEFSKPAWLITETIDNEQGCHFSAGARYSASFNRYVELKDGKLCLVAWSGEGSDYEIVSSVDDIINNGVLVFESDGYRYKLLAANNPLLIHSAKDTGTSNRYVAKYVVEERNSYGRVVKTTELPVGYGKEVPAYPAFGVWALLADDASVVDTDNSFDVSTYETSSATTPTWSSANSYRLGTLINAVIQ
ncbi:MAG: hypothetical protein NC418_00870 [Muribaculaceae bacterium]|nr:hypothetical protein [Muribaculaceae bacterium]